MTERKQFDDLETYVTNCDKTNVGRPHGSVLRPLLFFITDLRNNTSLWVFNFADDTLLNTSFHRTTYKKDDTYFRLHL